MRTILCSLVAILKCGKVKWEPLSQGTYESATLRVILGAKTTALLDNKLLETAVIYALWWSI